MKKHIKRISVILTALMLLSVTALPVSAYKVGDKVSTFAYTDIVTYINDTAIESFNINWETAVIVEDLAQYGFDVIWDPTPGSRNLKVTRNYGKPFSATYAPKASTHRNGDYAGDVLYTDIVTYFEGKKVESFNINGRTIVYVNDIAEFYAQPGTYRYDNGARILSLTLKGAASTTPVPSPAPAASSPLKFTTQPKSVNAAANSSVSFSVAVTGGKAPYTYKWEMKRPADTTWSDAGGSASIYSFTATQSWIDSGYMFRCVVTDADGTAIYSDYALLQGSAAAEPLTILTQPQNAEAKTLNQILSFTVTVKGGTSPYTYLWQKSTDGSVWTNLSSGNIQTYNLTADANLISSISYIRVIVTDVKGQSVTSSAATIIGSNYGQPAVPLSVKVECGTYGDTAIWKATPSGGTGGYKYQWQSNTVFIGGQWFWEDIKGETSQTFTVDTKGKTGTWTFRCVVTDSSGNTAYGEASYTKEAAAALSDITISGPASGYVGQAVTFTASVTGGKAPFTFIWQYLMPGDSWKTAIASGDSFKMNPIIAGTWQVFCMVTDANNDAVSSNTLTINVTDSTPNVVTTNVTVSNAKIGSPINQTMFFTDLSLPSPMSVTRDPANSNADQFGLSCGYSNDRFTISGTPTKAGTAVIRLEAQKNGTTYYIDIKIVIT